MGKSLSILSDVAIVAGACAALAFVLAVVFGLIGGDSASQSADASSSGVALEVPQSAQSAHASQSGQGPQSEASAAQSGSQGVPTPLDVPVPEPVEEVVTQGTVALSAPQTSQNAASVLAHSALEEHEATVKEWELLGYRQEGDASVEKVSVLTANEAGDRMQLLVCVDSSDVRVFNDNGEEVSDSQAPARSQLIVDVELIDGVWKVTNQTFPEDPDC